MHNHLVSSISKCSVYIRQAQFMGKKSYDTAIRRVIDELYNLTIIVIIEFIFKHFI
ncbi:unnamed protein product [Paramecium octaurelia]|uniref:Uncharacterized protein n=1 Tax=Paramecium octaurelia TaxID=43137 RepID=A0A8S1XFB2_PAROT|nr:unnamed protein product [Paramecium octaurelia]